MLGFYENFPMNIHQLEHFSSTISSQRLQQRLLQAFNDVNRKPFDIEKITQPSLHKCTVIFEIGIAEDNSFSYIDDEETKRLRDRLRRSPLQVLDFFIAVRYYQETTLKKSPLRFDYYMTRFIFKTNSSLDLQIFHERGPRHISPEDIANFVEKLVNNGSARKILKKTYEISPT